MPRFRVSGDHDLIPVLKKLGMHDAFGNGSDFSEMTALDVFINKVFQLSEISVDEDGTEAAAVTVVEMNEKGEAGSDTCEEFRVDRPFYFTVENRREGAVLFAGRVCTLDGTEVAKLPGDVNGDERTDISDVVSVINVIAGTDSNTKSDVNTDGSTDISDVVAVVNIVAGDGSGDRLDRPDAAVIAGLCPDNHHPHAVDLGFGLKFSCCNVGADAPWDCGSRFAWGETEEKDDFSIENYRLCHGSYESFEDIGSDIAGTGYDVARVRWGGGWRMPDHEQTGLLLKHCSVRQATLNGINGLLFTNNGNSIFLPATGIRYGVSWEGEPDGGDTGRYWSSTLYGSGDDISVAYEFGFIVGEYYWKGTEVRCSGLCVRPVME